MEIQKLYLIIKHIKSQRKNQLIKNLKIGTHIKVFYENKAKIDIN